MKIKDEIKVHLGYTISGTIVNDTKDMLYLLDRNKQPIDSAAIENQRFTFQGTISKPDIYHIVYDAKVIPLSLVLENENYDMLITQNNTLVAGGTLNTQLSQFHSANKAFNDIRLEALETYSADYISEKEFRMTLDSIKSVATQYSIDFMEENSGNLLSAIALETFSAPLERLQLLAKSTENNSNTEFTNALTDKINTLETAETERIAAAKKAAEDRIAYRPPAPQFSGTSLSGSNLSSASVLQGKKAVLIDFWASWCKPCRMVTPEVRYLYQKYNKLGFDILTISEDRNQSAWRQGVQEDQMTAWNHIYDNQMGIAGKFGVRALPHMVLLDANGKIIKDKISITQLKSELSKIFK